MDTDAIRRAWPDVLGRIFTRRRITWTFVSQHAQVMAYDGKTLTLGISTVGLTNTFRSGNHAEVVRQALIDELGVDAVVDGVFVEQAAAAQRVSPPPGAMPAPPPDPGAAPQSASQSASQSAPQSAPDPAGAEPAAQPPARPATDPASMRTPSRSPEHGRSGTAPAVSHPDRPPGPSIANSGLSPAAGRSLEDNAGWGSVTAPAPEWATAPSAPVAPAAAGGGGQTPRGSTKGASAVRESLDAARRSAPTESRAASPAAPSRPLTDDSAVSEDDEDIEVSTDVGRAVIEKVLGGRVISEFEE